MYPVLIPVLVFPVKLTRQLCIPDKILFQSRGMLVHIFWRDERRFVDYSYTMVTMMMKKPMQRRGDKKKENQWLVSFLSFVFPTRINKIQTMVLSCFFHSHHHLNILLLRWFGLEPILVPEFWFSCEQRGKENGFEMDPSLFCTHREDDLQFLPPFLSPNKNPSLHPASSPIAYPRVNPALEYFLPRSTWKLWLDEVKWARERRE